MSERYEDRSPTGRGLAAALTVAGHGLVALLLLLTTTKGTPVEVVPAIATFDVDQPGPPSPEPPKPKEVETPPLPPEPVIVPIPEIVLPTDNAMSVSVLEQVASEASGGGCDLTGPIQEALQADARVTMEMPSIAPDRRSVANALALWDRVWVEPDRRFPEPALASIQDTVRLMVAAASDTCRLQIQRGPRLIYLSGPDKTTVLALGSGEWSWQQVVDSLEVGPDGACKSWPWTRSPLTTRATCTTSPTLHRSSPPGTSGIRAERVPHARGASIDKPHGSTPGR